MSARHPEPSLPTPAPGWIFDRPLLMPAPVTDSTPSGPSAATVIAQAGSGELHNIEPTLRDSPDMDGDARSLGSSRVVTATVAADSCPSGRHVSKLRRHGAVKAEPRRKINPTRTWKSTSSAVTTICAFGLMICIVGLTMPPARAVPPAPELFLDQNWSMDDRLQYYYTSQGSAAVRYRIFLNLEQAHSLELFRSNRNLDHYGFVTQPADPKYNPDGLPIGLTKAIVSEGRWKGEWAGVTCAACHNQQLSYRGAKVRVAGGTNSRLDFYKMIDDLDDALQVALSEPAKFDRLAARMGKQNAPDREELRRQLRDDADSLHVYRTRTALTTTPAGPGRVDALQLIHNHVLASQLGVPANWRPARAPTKYSFVWNIPQSAWAQWSGVLPDPLLRNGGESIGVFVKSDFSSPTIAKGLFESTIDLKGQIRLEELLRKLAPPQWPESVLGRIDRAKAATGKGLFAENCASCHSTWPHRWSEPRLNGLRFIENAIVAETVIGTDPRQFGTPQFESDPAFKPGALGQFMTPPQPPASLAVQGDIFDVFRTVFFTGHLDKLGLSPEQRASAHGFGPVFPAPPLPLPAAPAYKANPAEGMWANPPFLHNGSVPNLYELLLPASKRTKKFYVGRDYDPVRVGIDTSGRTGRFLFDTALIGNSNAGHSFENGRGPGIIGRELTDPERWAIIEYMKSIPEAPAQVAPFGGPAHPVRAWLDPTFYHVRHPGTFNGAPKLTATAANAAPARRN